MSDTITEKKTRKRTVGCTASQTPNGKIVYAALAVMQISMAEWCRRNGVPHLVVSDVLRGRLTGERAGRTGTVADVIEKLERDFIGVEFLKAKP